MMTHSWAFNSLSGIQEGVGRRLLRCEDTTFNSLSGILEDALSAPLPHFLTFNSPSGILTGTAPPDRGLQSFNSLSGIHIS